MFNLLKSKKVYPLLSIYIPDDKQIHKQNEQQYNAINICNQQYNPRNVYAFTDIPYISITQTPSKASLEEREGKQIPEFTKVIKFIDTA